MRQGGEYRDPSPTTIHAPRQTNYRRILPQSAGPRRYAHSMDAKLAYWTAAALNMALLMGFAASGVRRVQNGQVARHRRRMLTAVALVLAFVLSYTIKLAALGREDLSVWSDAAVWTLRFHELCVFTMLISGGLALRRGLALARTQTLMEDPDAPQALPKDLKGHGRAGKVAVLAAGLGFLSACAVLASMYGRALS
ncbi:MAG TPA: DUF420 domain-containing protein [Myxococcales bacterium]|nr:DUF420 domain-containing protein [Myxococcales bacterium]